MTHHILHDWSERVSAAQDSVLEIFPPKPDRTFFLLGHIKPRHDIRYSGPAGEQWTAIQELIAWHLACPADEISCRDVWFGKDEDEFFELIMRKDCIVGSFDRELTDVDLQAIEAAK